MRNYRVDVRNLTASLDDFVIGYQSDEQVCKAVGEYVLQRDGVLEFEITICHTYKLTVVREACAH